MNSKRNKILAIALDAAPPAFVRQLIDDGRMPNLKALLSNGRWMRVDSTAYIGSGSVWPTFVTGKDAAQHGVYGEWVWQPETMDVTHYHGNDLPPFWKDFEEQQLTVGILDLPFMPLVGLSRGFEISEWGPHDVLEGKTQLGPADVLRMVSEHSKHPLSFNTKVSGPDDYTNLQKLADACVQGAYIRGALARRLIAETRPDFCLIVFPETHRGGHYLWHRAEPHHALYRNNGFANLKATEPSLLSVYQAVDSQVGEIVKNFPEYSSVMVFSLHGMQPTHGVPDFLRLVLSQAGFSRLNEWGDQNWKDRATTLIAHVKRLMPAPVKKLYYSTVPAKTTHRVARSTVLPPYDWRRTKAFALPTDQHGWIRVNLIGRETQGIVPPEDYEKTCNELENLVRGLTSHDGRPLAGKITRTARRVEEALTQRIPDLIIHWEQVVFEKPLKIQGFKDPPENIGKNVGQHSLEGFAILSGSLSVYEGESLRSTDMRKLFVEQLKGDRESAQDVV